MSARRPHQPSIAPCLLRPFYKLLGHYQLGSMAGALEARPQPPWERVPLQHAHALMESAIKLTGDVDLGLKAGRLTDFEDAGPLAYAAGSAATLHQAILVCSRYMRLLNDAMDFHYLAEGSRVSVWMDSKIPLPRASADFQASAIHAYHRRTHAMTIPGLEWWFKHQRPENTDEYVRTFGDATLRFSMPHFAFCFDARYLDLSQTTADARQHELLLRQMDAALSNLSPTAQMSDRVRNLIVSQLPTGQVGALQVAKALGISHRTLARRLFAEEATFWQLLDGTRRRLALHYVQDPERSILSIALLLGYSEATTFNRAFKRWVADTPGGFRRSVGQPPA